MFPFKKNFIEPKSSAVSLLGTRGKIAFKIRELIKEFITLWQTLKRCMGITSEILVEFLNIHHHRIQKEPMMMVLRLNLKGILK